MRNVRQHQPAEKQVRRPMEIRKTRIPDARFQYLDHWFQNNLPILVIGEFNPVAPVKRVN